MVVYENESVLVIDKPCGVPSQMGTGLGVHKNPSVDVLAKAYLGGEESEVTPYLVHRLDRATSGLMCLAKSKDMARYLSTQMQEQQVTKEYTALLADFLKESTVYNFPTRGCIR